MTKSNNEKVTLRDIWVLSDKMDGKLDDMKKESQILFLEVSKRVTGLEIWKETLTAKISLIVGAIALVFNLGWDWFKQKFNK